VCRQANVYEDCSRDDENDVDRCPLINDSHDVIGRDVRGDVRSDATDGPMLKSSSAAVQGHHQADAVPLPHRPTPAQDDEVDAVSDAVRRVSTAATAQRGGSQVSPIPMSAVGSSPSPSQQRRYTRPAAPRSPDTERWRCPPRRPESSPSSTTRRVSCGDRVDASSVDGVRTTSAGIRRAPVSRANTTGEYLLQVPDVVYCPPPSTRLTSPVAVPTSARSSSESVDLQLSSSLPERWPTAQRPAQTRHAPRVYYSNSEDRVSATDAETRATVPENHAETRAIVPSLPYSTCASPGGSPRLRRQPTIETRRLSVSETDEGWTQLNQYKLKDEIGKVCSQSNSACFCVSVLRTFYLHSCQKVTR